MSYIVDQQYPYGLKEYTRTEIIDLGLEFIENISVEQIEYGTDEMKTFIKSIKEKCGGKHLWVLFGSNDKEKWIPFQVASKKSNIVSEIRTDFLCMTSFDEQRDKRKWSSYYHDSVMEIEYCRDVRCQKYGLTRKLCSYLAVVVISNEYLIEEANYKGMTKYQIKECELAQKLKPLLWNPAGKEYAYLNSKSHKE